MKQNPFISPYASEHRKRKLIIALFFLVVMTLGVIYMICKQTSEPPQKTDTVYLRQQMMQALWQEDYAKVHQLYTTWHRNGKIWNPTQKNAVLIGAVKSMN